jgi:NAD(P)-dependent dehydrogenase (short-subunit alcohol dehydrogenase family)
MKSETSMRAEIALVSGAGSGIGRTVALRLAGRGATIGVLDRDRAGTEETVTLVKQMGGRAEALIADVSSMAEVNAAVAGFAVSPEVGSYTGCPRRPGIRSSTLT